MSGLNRRWYMLAFPVLLGVVAAVLWLGPIRLTSVLSAPAETDAATDVAVQPDSARSAARPAANTLAVATSTPRANGNRNALVRRGSISDTMRLFGRVVPQQEMAIVAPTDGRLASLSVQVGATVSTGQLIGRLDPDVPLLGAGALPDPVGLMRAPWSGAITDVQLHAGDRADAGQVVVTLARREDPLVRLDLTEQDAARIAVGQLASVQDTSATADGPANRLAGLVVDLVATQDGKSALGLIQLDWVGHPADFGTVVDLEVAVQRKTDVLLVPARAVHSLGDRHFVEYMDAGLRKTANVEVGIISGDEVEIRQGLSEGQQVIAQ